MLRRAKGRLMIVWVVARSLILYFYNHWITFFPVFLVRKFYLKYIVGVLVGDQSFIHMGCVFYPNSIVIGNNSVIGRGCHLLGDIIIKDNVSITAQSYIFSASHHKNSASFEYYSAPVVIEDFAWIGARAMILPGVKIGKGAVLGAASTATKNIPDYAIFVGVPAKQVGERSRELDYRLVYSPYFQ